MKKKFTGLLICFMLICISLFAGCSLVETNNDKLYNAVVSEIKNKEGVKVAEITNRELLSGYESYGATYVQSYGYTKEKAVDMTLTQLQNRKITVLTAEDIFGIKSTGEGLSTLEKTYLWEKTASSLKSNIDYYYNEIVGEKEEESSTSIVFTGYSKNATLEKDENNSYVIKKEDKKDGVLDSFRPEGADRDYNNENDRKKLYDDFMEYKTINADYEKAFNLYLTDLKTAEYGMKLSTETKSMVEREIKRLYNIAYENYMVEKYQEYVVKEDDISYSVNVDDILNLYSSKVRTAYTQYVIEGDSGYDDDVKNSLNDVYYFKTDSNSTQYFTVANILFKFNDNQTATFNEIKTKYESNNGNYDFESYQHDLDALYSSIEPVIRKLNNVTGAYEEIENVDNLTVEDIIKDKIQIAIQSAQTTGNINFIGDTINELIYQYNEDSGMFNAESNYVIGVDKDGKAVSSFVEEFNNAGLKLYNEGKIGNFEVTRSDYGIHVVIYMGKCENLFGGIDYSFDLSRKNDESLQGQSAIEVLYSTRVNPLVDKTYFDVLYDEIYSDDSSYYISANLNILRNNYDIYVYSSRFADSLR